MISEHQKSWTTITNNYETLPECSSQSTSNLKPPGAGVIQHGVQKLIQLQFLYRRFCIITVQKNILATLSNNAFLLFDTFISSEAILGLVILLVSQHTWFKVPGSRTCMVRYAEFMNVNSLFLASHTRKINLGQKSSREDI